jgi:pimeloyl-ACP methyl ester carboxylesterase
MAGTRVEPDRQQPPRVRYAKRGGFNLAYQVVGEGPVDLVLAPGWATHLDLAWEVPGLARFLRRLASISRLVLFDERGTGLSDRVAPDAPPTLEERTDDLLAVMDAAGSQRAVLFGTLGGAAACSLLAATCPERALALVLYGTGARPLAGGPLGGLDPSEAALDRLEREWGTGGAGLAVCAPSLTGDDQAVAAYLRLLRSGVSPGSARSLARAASGVDWEAVLPAVRVPTLVLHRTGDLVVPVGEGRRLAERLPEASFVDLPGVDHLVWAGDQDAVVDRLRRFLAEAGPAPHHRRRLVTVLSTDLVVTSPRPLPGGRAWQELLGAHRAVVRANLQRYGGREARTAGDGLLATFLRPGQAIRCADAIIAAARPVGLRVRAGVACGECELVEDGPRGPTVAQAAAMTALARPGEILVSRLVRDLATGPAIGFEPRRAHPLDGVQDAGELFRASLPSR